MASLISATEKATILNLISGSFDTWCRPIVVYKEPTKTLVDSPQTQDNLFGFGESQHEPIYSYTPTSGVFDAIIRYTDIRRDLADHAALNPEIMARIYSAPIGIKVKKDCRDFINNGPTERITFDDMTFLLDGDERKQTFQGSEYYIFPLRKTL